MARNPVTQFNINATKATKALADVTAGLKNYNREVKEATKNHKAFNTAAAKARADMQAFSKEVQKSARMTRDLVSSLSLMRSQVNATAANLGKLSAVTVTLATNTQAASHFMLFAAKNAAKLGVDLRNAATATRQFERAIQKDTQAIRDNALAFRALSVEISRIVKDMKLKNRTIDEQVAAAQRDKRATNELTISLSELTKIIIVQFVHRALSEMIRGISDSVRAAQELQIRIGEIQTVSLEMSGTVLKTAKSTEQWTHSLLALSRNMGIGTLEQAEGIYEALSNQVVKANSATAFMAQEMKLAITTASSLNQAVDVTSTVINAYGKSSNDAASINAVLFRGVDVGRFRLDELGSSFGRTNVLAAQLGVSFEEVVGTLALLTRLGLKADVANTLLTNTFNGLIKPSKELDAVFQRWGVSSAEAALQTFGFAGVFKKLAAEVSDGTSILSETAGIFDDLRALTGASALIKNLDGLEQSINDVTNATEHFNTAFETQQKNLGVRGKIQLEQFKQYFLVRFGLPIQRQLVQISERFGGSGHAIDGFLIALRRGAVALAVFRIATFQFAAANTRAAAAAAAAASGVTLQTAANRGLIASFWSLSAAQAGATLGLTLIISVLAEVVAQVIATRSSFELLRIELEANIVEEARKNFEAFTDTLDRNSKVMQASFKANSRAWLVVVADLRALNNSLSEDFEKNFKKIKKSMKDGLDVATENIEGNLKKLRKEIEATEKAIESATDRLTALKVLDKNEAFDATLNTKTDVEKVRTIEDEKTRVFNEALDARRAGEDKLADDLLKREEELRDKQIDLLKKIREEASKEVVVGRTTIDSKGNLTDVDIDPETGARSSIRIRAGSGRNNRPIRGSGRNFTRSGTSPTVTLAKTEVETRVKDAARVLLVEQALERIEADRVERRKEQIALEERLLKVKNDQLIVQKKEEASRTKAFDAFKETVSEIDSIDKTGKSGDLSALLVTADQQGRAAGLGNKELFVFLREASKLKLELARKEVKEETEVRLVAIEKEVADAEKIRTEALTRRKEAEAEFQRQTNDVIKNNLLTVADLDNELKHTGVSALNAAGTPAFTTGNQAVNNARTALSEVERISKELQAKQTKARETGSGFVTKEDLDRLQIAQVKLEAFLHKLNDVQELGKTKFNQRITVGPVQRDAEGRLAFKPDGGELPEAFEARAKALQKEIQKTKESAQIIVEASAAINIALATEQEAQRTRNTLEAQYGDLRRAIEDTTERGVQAQKRINEELDKTIERLRIINSVGRGDQQLANGGKINYRAFGGRGTDRQLTATSAGEFVSTRLATRQYAPLLHALNKQPPAFRANGGNTLNFGDIHINTSEGTSSMQAQEIASKLTRLTHQGRYSRK